MPDRLAKEWKKRVGSIVDGGYGYTVFEFDDDLWIRGAIEHLLRDNELGGHKEMSLFRSEIDKSDRELRYLFMPDIVRPKADNWWEAGILKEGGPAYVESIMAMYGVAVKEL
jgi:hypothetical protein